MRRALTRSQLKVRMLRAASGLSQDEFERQVQLDNIASIEHGIRQPSTAHLAQMAELMGLTPDDCEEMLRDYETRIARNAENPANTEGEPGSRLALREADSSLESVIDGFGARRANPWVKSHAAKAEREEARKSWASLRKLASIEEMSLVVRVAREYQCWGIVEILCKESVRGVSTHLEGDGSLDLAGLAVAAAEQIRAAEGWCQRVRGFAMFYLAAAQRRAGRTEEAEVTQAGAKRLWDAGWDPEEILVLVDPIEMIPPPPPTAFVPGTG